MTVTPHDEDDGHGHDDDDAYVHAGDFDQLELTTVGIDIGSATTHVMLAHLTLRRDGQDLSNRYTVKQRSILYQAPTLLTPYAANNEIDADALRSHIERAYATAGLSIGDIDSGAVILTGNALLRRNARSLAEIFAVGSGHFVCASAGHHLEALLAAHGSGAIARSAGAGSNVLTVDIGGGTTKYAAIRDGVVVATWAVAGGGRILAWDLDGSLERLEQSGADLGKEVGVDLMLGQAMGVELRRALGDRLATRIRTWMTGMGDPRHRLDGSPPTDFTADEITLSGGVGGLVAGAATEDIADLGPYIATALAREVADIGTPVRIAASPMHATVVGASQFTVQVSGNTIHLGSDGVLPLRNLPVAVLDLNGAVDPSAREVETAAAHALRRVRVDHEGAVALAVHWRGTPRYRTLSALAQGIHAAHVSVMGTASPLVVAVGTDIAASLGRLIEIESTTERAVLVVDGIDLTGLDYLDVGEPILPANVVPVVIKSLVFAPAEP